MKIGRINKAPMIAMVIGCSVWLSCSTGVMTGQTVKETRNLTEFNSISLAISANILLTQGENQSVVIEADKGVSGDIITEIKEKKLVIKTEPGHRRNLSDVNIYITMKDIEQIQVTGSGNITAQSTIHSDNIDINISGSGDVKIATLQSPKISLQITGSGSMNLAGKNDQAELEATITGSGSIKSDDLMVANASVTITGSGNARVNVMKALQTNITGSGSVLYKGNPIINAHSTGSGRTSTL